MTQKRVKASDVIGNSYYIYTLQSSNNTPSLNSTINITCNVTDVYGQAISGKSITLYQNNTSKGAKTTDSSGNASWNSISMSSAGLQVFKVENSKIEVFVDNKSDVGHTHSQYLTEHQSLSNYVTTDDSRLSDSRTPTSHTHGNLQNNGQVGSTAQANKNVVTNSSGLITTEDKPTIPSASSTTPSADTTSGSVGTGTTWARSNHTHPKSSLYAESSHNHTKSQITDFPSIPSKTSDLQNDSGFLTSHQSLSGYLQTSDVKDNLTSTDTNKPLSANQGKELKALIDNKEDNIYRIVGTGTSTYSNRVRLDCGTFPFDSANGKILVYVVPNISSLSESLVVDLLGAYPSGVSTAFPMRKSNDTTLTIGEIQTGDELLLFYESSAWRLIGNSSISGKEDKSNKVSSWSSTTTDNHYPSEKLVKDSLDGKLDKTHTSYKGKNVVTNASTGAIEFEDKNNHTHSNYLTSNDISGKIDTAGTGLSKSGTTLNHSNSVTALTTASFKKVQYDSQGHITGTSDVSASDLPTHTHSQYLTSHQDITGKEDSSNKVSSWNSTTNNIRYPTEKLVKDSLDGKQATLVSGTNIRTINNTSILGSGDIFIPTPPTIVTAWETTPSDSKVVSEKLVKDSLDGKSDNGHTHSQYLTSHQDISGKENTSNKVTSISSSSTDTQYPSAKCVFDKLNGYLTSNEEVIFVNGTNQSTDTTTNTFTGTTSKLDSMNSVVDGTKLIYKVSVTSTNDTNDLRLSLGTNSGVVERYIKSDNTYTTANLYPTYTLLFLVFFNSAWHIIGQSNPKLKNRIVDLIYPIGSIYMSVNNVSPQTLFGGSWEQIQDTFLLASGSTYSPGSTGGSADATLVSHQHGTNTSGEYFVTSESSEANNTRVTYSSSGNRYVDGMNASTTPFHHRVGTGYVGSSATGKNMPPYLAVNVWKRIA